MTEAKDTFRDVALGVPGAERIEALTGVRYSTCIGATLGEQRVRWVDRIRTILVRRGDYDACVAIGDVSNRQHRLHWCLRRNRGLL